MQSFRDPVVSWRHKSRRAVTIIPSWKKNQGAQVMLKEDFLDRFYTKVYLEAKRRKQFPDEQIEDLIENVIDDMIKLLNKDKSDENQS